LRCRVTLPFAELRQTLLVDAINLGLHLGMPALDQDREFADQPSRAKPIEYGTGWRKEYFSYSFNPLPHAGAPRWEDRGRQPELSAQPDAAALRQIYTDELLWRIRRVKS
jgi:hypothetical protein